LIADLIRSRGIRPRLFVEPFAGGACVALHLLSENLVDRVGLGDLDPLVASFWRVAIWDTEWLMKAYERLVPSIELWQWFKQSRPRTDRSRALKCLFLNRTSFGGIMAESVGPLGGWAQNSAYQIGCRFSPKAVRQRLTSLSQLKDRIAFVREGDWQSTLRESKRRVRRPGELLAYFVDFPRFSGVHVNGQGGVSHTPLEFGTPVPSDVGGGCNRPRCSRTA